MEKKASRRRKQRVSSSYSTGIFIKIGDQLCSSQVYRIEEHVEVSMKPTTAARDIALDGPRDHALLARLCLGVNVVGGDRHCQGDGARNVRIHDEPTDVSGFITL